MDQRQAKADCERYNSRWRTAIRSAQNDHQEGKGEKHPSLGRLADGLA